MDDDKKRALSAALGQIERQFGKGAIMRMGDTAQSMDISAISTGSLNLDVALGIGGLPRGRVVEIYGPESSGKTTLTLEVIAQAQRAGGTAAFVDAEHALDPQYAEKLEPTELFDFLNDFQSRMSTIVNRNGGLVNTFMGDGMMAVFGAPKISDRHADQAVKAFLRDNMYRHHRVNRMTSKARRVVGEMFDLLFAEPELLPLEWRRRASEKDDAGRARVIADYIAGMTDRYALETHRKLFSPEAL